MADFKIYKKQITWKMLGTFSDKKKIEIEEDIKSLLDDGWSIIKIDLLEQIIVAFLIK